MSTIDKILALLAARFRYEKGYLVLSTTAYNTVKGILGTKDHSAGRAVWNLMCVSEGGNLSSFKVNWLDGRARKAIQDGINGKIYKEHDIDATVVDIPAAQAMVEIVCHSDPEDKPTGRAMTLELNTHAQAGEAPMRLHIVNQE